MNNHRSPSHHPSPPIILPSSHLLKICNKTNIALSSLPYPQSQSQSHSHPHHSPLIYAKVPQIKQKSCQKLGLDSKNLYIQQFLQYDAYKRLYTIVQNSQTSKNELYKCNLIKQLYFLLEITPFIRLNLRHDFLSKVQEWYISNDHQKIYLSQNLTGIITNGLNHKSLSDNTNFYNNNQNKFRPKSGVTWDTNLQPFLRPYTAKITKNNPPKPSPHTPFTLSTQNTPHRPTSSKYAIRSTKANTNIQTQTSPQQKYLHPSPHPQSLNPSNNDQFNNQKYQNLTQFQNTKQQFQHHQDFINKYRTIHPQQQPPYQKLMNLISNIQLTNQYQYHNHQLPSNQFIKTNPIITTNKSSNNLNVINKQNNAQSSMPTTSQNNIHAIAIQQLQQNKQQNNNNDAIQPSQHSSTNQNQSSSQHSLQNLQQKPNQRLYSCDRRTKSTRHPRPPHQNHLYTTLNGIKILRPYTSNQSHILNKLNTYSTNDQNKKIIQCIQDQQIATQYRQYIRKKNHIQKQHSRKIQTRKFVNHPKIVDIIFNQNKQNTQQIKTTNNTTKTKQHKKTNNFIANFNDLNLKKQPQPLYLDFSTNQPTQPSPSPKYSLKTYFHHPLHQSITTTARGIHNLDLDYNIQHGINTLTHYQRLLSQQRFNPVHKTNIDTYNQQILNQIQLIKQKLHGKITTTTDALYKALYIDTSNPLTNNTQIKQQKSNQFLIPDKNYLMIRKQQKKKKKKFKKINHHKYQSTPLSKR